MEVYLRHMKEVVRKYLYTPEYAKQIKWFWRIFISGLVLFNLLIFLVAMGWLGDMPKLEDIENPKNNLATEIISSDGVVLGKYYVQNRSNEDYQSLGQNLINALIATEDVRFYQHAGIDFRALSTSVLYNLVLKKRGASTISQQTAKNLFPRKKFNNVFSKTFTKLKEWVLAVQIEKRYTKEEIINLYFNTVQFGGNSFGVKSASRSYFNKLPSELTVPEAALLVGMLKGIGKYNPIKHPKSASDRRNTVISQMQKYHFITEEEETKYKSEPMTLRYSQDDHNDGLATYFREFLRKELEKWADENGYDIYKDGLKVYTTIDSRMQRYGEEAMNEHLSALQGEFNKVYSSQKPGGEDLKGILEKAMKNTDRYRSLINSGATQDQIKRVFDTPVKTTLFSYRGEFDTLLSPMDSILYYKKFLLSGFMAMDPHSGQVKAWVGGQNYKYFKYDHASPNSSRQVGSTFKPFVYSLAVDNGYSPCTLIPNQPVTFENFENWTPSNAEGYKGKELTMYQGLAFSVNYIVAYLLKQLGPDGPQKVIDMARNLGISAKLEPYPSICLGVFDVSVLEMTGAFAAFANKGVSIKPYYLTRITDKNGNVLKEFIPESREAMSEQTSYIMLKLMEGVTSHGTGYEVKGKYKIKGATAGKTGTTQNNSDGWFMGITPNLVAGCWVGCEDRAIHFRSTAQGSGAHMALPIWGKFFQKVQADSSIQIEFPDYFEPPQKKLTIEIDCNKFSSEENSGSEINFNGKDE